MKLFYEPREQQYYVLYQSPGKDLLFRVDQVKPTMLSRIYENAFFHSRQERDKLIAEMEEFVKTEIEKLNDYY